MYVFTKEAVFRSIAKLQENPIHEHFAGYLAILRARQSNKGLDIRSADITEFHDRYLRVIGAHDKAPYVRPFKSRGRGLETFNANVAGSYAISSLRESGKFTDVVAVSGSKRNVAYELRPNHEARALNKLLNGSRVPIGALTAFIYRDYGFVLEEPRVERIVRLFRDEFGLAQDDDDQRRVFNTLFYDDLSSFNDRDIEIVSGSSGADG